MNDLRSTDLPGAAHLAKLAAAYDDVDDDRPTPREAQLDEALDHEQNDD